MSIIFDANQALAENEHIAELPFQADIRTDFVIASGYNGACTNAFVQYSALCVGPTPAGIVYVGQVRFFKA